MGELTLIGVVPRGRPNSYNQDTADRICERLSHGESLRSICRDEDMPSITTVLKWRTMNEGPGFAAQYARARENQADWFADQVIEIADSEEIEADQKRVMIDARKWRAGRQKPKSWGDRVTHEHEIVTDERMTKDALPSGLAFLTSHAEQGEAE